MSEYLAVTCVYAHKDIQKNRHTHAHRHTPWYLPEAQRGRSIDFSVDFWGGNPEGRLASTYALSRVN